MVLRLPVNGVGESGSSQAPPAIASCSPHAYTSSDSADDHVQHGLPPRFDDDGLGLVGGFEQTSSQLAGVVRMHPVGFGVLAAVHLDPLLLADLTDLNDDCHDLPLVFGGLRHQLHVIAMGEDVVDELGGLLGAQSNVDVTHLDFEQGMMAGAGSHADLGVLGDDGGRGPEAFGDFHGWL